MKKIFFIIIIIFLLGIILINHNKECFYPGKNIKSYPQVVNINLKPNKVFKTKLKNIGFIDTEMSSNIKKKTKNFLLKNNQQLATFPFNNLLDMIIIIYIIEGNIDAKMSKQNLKKLLYQYFGDFAFLRVKLSMNVDDPDSNLVDGINVQIPMDAIQRINWLHYEKIFESITPEKNLTIEDLVKIKKNILLQQFVDNQITLLRAPIIYDENTNNYVNNYYKLINSEHKSNYVTELSKNENLNYISDFSTNYMLEIYERLQLKKTQNKIIFQEIYTNMMADTNIPFSLIFGNIYLTSEKFLDKILKSVERKKKILPNNWLDMDNTNFLSTVENYPLRFQKPLNYKCERIWYDCTDEDRINNYYKYYKIPEMKKNIMFTKASKNSKVYFPIGIKK